MNIIVVGVGALGSNLLPLLRNAEAEVSIVDYDRVEAKNLLTQTYARAQIGKAKVVALASTMDFLWKWRVHVKNAKLAEGNVDELLHGADLIVDCVDNMEARRVMQVYAGRTDTALVHGALAADGALGRVAWSPSFAPDAAAPGAPTCDGAEHLPLIVRTSALLAETVLRYVRTKQRPSWLVYAEGARRI